VKILNVVANNRRRGFEIKTRRGIYWLPYAKVEPRPGRGEHVTEVRVDPELAREGFGFRLHSGVEGSAHIEQALDYCRDPSYMRDMLLHKLTLEAQRRVEASGLSRREVIRRLRTSPAQFYRLLDQTNYRKSIDRMVSLLAVLDCEVNLVVRAKTA
jgi:GNAT superfamily N-acetyltransferase